MDEEEVLAMNADDFRALVARCVAILREHAPIDTGNLRHNSVRLVWEDNDQTARIYIDEAIAPYMPYTNEPWVSPRWHGRKNPNLYWFDRAAKAITEEIAKTTGTTGARADSPVNLDLSTLATEYGVQEDDIRINSIYNANEGIFPKTTKSRKSP